MGLEPSEQGEEQPEMRLKSKVGSRGKVGQGKEFGYYSKCNEEALKIFYARDYP